MKTNKYPGISTLLAVLAFGAIALLDAGAEDANDMNNEEISKELNSIKKDVQTANTDAADNIPDSGKKKIAEDVLDGQEKKLDDAEATLKRVKANKKSTDAQKEKAQKAVDKAKKGRDDYKDFADTIESSDTDTDAAYRKALADKRAARSRLKELIGALKKRLPHNRAQVQPVAQRASRLLGEAQKRISESKNKSTTGLFGRDKSHDTALLASGSSIRNSIAVGSRNQTRNHGHGKKCKF